MISATELSALKFVVWDLDDTLWTGLLDSGDELRPTGLHRWIEPLALAGVMSSVCSNNDFARAEDALRLLGVWEYVVFPKVSWAPKVEMLSELLADVRVRPTDVMFVDDLLRHRRLASEELGCLIAAPTEIDPYCGQLEAAQDSNRLDQYRLLERRARSRELLKVSDEDFLRRSSITVTITPAAPHVARLATLSQRSNQLNFTGSRLQEATLLALAADPEVDSGAVWVRDNYGDYGLSGYFACRGKDLEHFYFSCRILNMGIESFVYDQLGRPTIESRQATVREESWRQLMSNAPWVRLGELPGEVQQVRQRTLWIGGCDLQILSSYLGHDADTDTWLLPAENGGAQVYARSSLLALVADESQRGVFSVVPWLTADTVDVRGGSWRDLVLSPWVDCASWTYRHRETTVRIPSFVALSSESSDWEWEHWWGDSPGRERFLDEFELDDPLSPDDVIQMLSGLASMVDGRRLLVMTVPEIASDRIYPWGESQRDRHVAFNDALECVTDELENVELLDVRDVISSGADLHDPDDPVLFHFRRDRYLDLARLAQTRLSSANDVEA